MSPMMPRSALRHRPIHTDVQEWIVATPCTTRSLIPLSAKATTQLPPLVLIGASMLITLLCLWIAQGVGTWSSVQLDTLRYGFPRTTQVAHAAGHGGMSNFLATNEAGQIYVLEIPAGKPAAAHLLVGPHLIGSGAALAPVQLVFVGSRQQPDLLVEVQGIVTRFHNTGNTYVAAPAT